MYDNIIMIILKIDPKFVSRDSNSSLKLLRPFNSSNVRELETFQISLGSSIVSYEVVSGFCDVITFIGQVFVCSVST